MHFQCIMLLLSAVLYVLLSAVCKEYRWRLGHTRPFTGLFTARFTVLAVGRDRLTDSGWKFQNIISTKNSAFNFYLPFSSRVSAAVLKNKEDERNMLDQHFYVRIAHMVSKEREREGGMTYLFNWLKICIVLFSSLKSVLRFGNCTDISPNF